MISLYNLACRARLGDIIDPLLWGFVESFQGPKLSSLSPERPSEKQGNEYTVWLTIRGVDQAENIAKTPGQPLTLSEAVGVYAKLNRDFITSSHNELLNTLDSMQDFLSLMLRYPMMPRVALDTKECPECYFEAEITIDTWEEKRRNISCCHFTLRHEQFEIEKTDDPANVEHSDCAYVDDDDDDGTTGEMVRAGPSGRLFLLDVTKDDEI